MKLPPIDHTNLWNDMPMEERLRLLPYVRELQLHVIMNCKQQAIRAHEAHIRGLDDWMDNIGRDLDKYINEE